MGEPEYEETVSESLLRVFGLLIAIAIPLASFVTGLRSTEPLWLWRRPKLLGRSLLVILILVPVLAAILLELLAPNDVFARAGIMISILAIGIGPPDLMKRAQEPTTVRYEVGLNETLMVLAILYLPLAMDIHGAAFHHQFRVSSWAVTKIVLGQALLPFVAGLAVARALPEKVETPLERYGGSFVKLAMLVVVVFALVIAWRPLIGLGPFVWLTCAVVAMIAILIGHALGGPQPEARSVLAAFSAMRFPGLALLIVSSVPRGKLLIPVVLAYVITSAALVGAYRAARPKPGETEVEPRRERETSS